MSRHTEGRWVVKHWGSDTDEWPERRITVGPNGTAVAISPRYPSDTTEADFTLMASAPELLAACKALLEDADQYRGLRVERLEQMAEAVARAEGKEEGYQT